MTAHAAEPAPVVPPMPERTPKALRRRCVDWTLKAQAARDGLPEHVRQ
ncbi:hypothetical protein ACWCPF_08290 [Streptomyces sp. NPDC001858]